MQKQIMKHALLYADHLRCDLLCQETFIQCLRSIRHPRQFKAQSNSFRNQRIFSSSLRAQSRPMRCVITFHQHAAYSTLGP